MKTEGKNWTLIHGDAVEECGKMADESIDYSIFSPPFASLYTYTDDERDMGNCLTHDEFFEHFDFLIPQLFRVLKPGRNLSFHCMNLPLSKERDGVIGLRDFRGLLIRAFESAGFVFHSEVCIWKDPVTAMQRTKAIGLLWKQLRKDSTISRQGIPDYFVTMRKPGVNAEPITHSMEEFPVSIWQKWASPVWDDIDFGNTLQYTHARTEKDERHICPLSLDITMRGIALWSNRGDTVLSPFSGIGSEGHQSIIMDRSYVGVELKREYYDWSIHNLRAAEQLSKQVSIFQVTA